MYLQTGELFWLLLQSDIVEVKLISATDVVSEILSISLSAIFWCSVNKWLLTTKLEKIRG